MRPLPVSLKLSEIFRTNRSVLPNDLGQRTVNLVTIRQLQVFLAVARSESLAEAARELFMSKSAVSQALSELQSRLAVRLFEKRLFLTEEGRRLMPQADETVRRAADIPTLFGAGAGHGSLRTGCSLTVGAFMIAGLLKDFEDAYGWIPSVTIANTHDLTERLKNFEIDTALVEGPAFDADLVSEPWMTDEIRLRAAGRATKSSRASAGCFGRRIRPRAFSLKRSSGPDFRRRRCTASSTVSTPF